MDNRMNKKAEESGSSAVLFMIGLILAAIAIFATYPFLLKIVGIFTPKADEPTMNSFELLEKELLRLPDGEQHEIPYYVKDGWYLRSGIALCPSNRLCICKDKSCNSIVKDGVKQIGSYTFSEVDIEGSIYGVGTLKNIGIRRSGTRIDIQSTTT